MDEIDWSELAEVYDHFNSTKYNVVLPMFCTWVVERLDERGLSDPERMVEVGCGNGLISEMLANWYPKTDFLLNDRHPAMVRFSRRRLESLGERVSMEEADGLDFLRGLADGSADVVLFSRSLYVLGNHESVAAEVMRVLSPDGLVFILDFLSAVDLAPLDEHFSSLEPEKWPLVRPVYEDFNDGIAEGRYRLHSKESLLSLWRGVGGKPVTYQTNMPHSNTHFMCTAKPE